MPVRKTKETFIEEANLIHNNEYDYSLVDYKNNRTKVKIIHKICGSEFEQTPSNHLHKTNPQGCPYCYGNTLMTKEQFIEKSKKTWGELSYDYSKVNYVNSRTKVFLKCNKHNYWFEQSPKKHYLGQGCIFCQPKSKGEDKIASFLKEHNIDFKKEYSFKDCKYKRILPFDFYLPDYNIVIEYQGEQHFKQDRREHSEKLELRQFKDKIKRQYCYQNNIIEIELCYFDNLNEKLYNLLELLEDTKCLDPLTLVESKELI